MKKRRLGERPSQFKQRGSMIEVGENDGDTPRRPTASNRQARTTQCRRPSQRRTYRWVFLLALCAVLAAAAGAVIAAGGKPFTLQVAHIQIHTGTTLQKIEPGEEIRVAYGDGLILKNIAFGGWYRLLPPASAVIRIENIEESANRFNKNLLLLVQPEQQLEYRLVIGTDTVAELASFPLQITMSAADWIDRSEQVQDPDAQAVCLENAVKLDPGSQDARVALGRLYEARNQRSRAVAEYEAVVKINPRHAGALRSLIRLYEGDRRKVIPLSQAYESLAQIDTTAADRLYFKAAELARNAGRTQHAVELYRKTLQANRGHIPARQQLIKIYDNRTEWNRAAANTAVLLEYEPRNADLRLYLSEMHINMRNFDTALREAKHAARLRPTDAGVYLHVAMLAEKANDPAEAISYYKKAFQHDKKNHLLCNNLALLLEKQGNRREAITYYRQAVSLDPANIGYRLNLADILEKEGRLKEAAEAYAALVARDKNNKRAWEALAVLQEQAKNPRKALEAYQALCRLEPKNIFWLQKAAALHEELGEIAKARDRFEAVLDIDPQHAQARRKYVELSKQLIVE